MRGDGSCDHIPWANWLHEQLETYRVPDGFRDRVTATGEPMPQRFFPTFRDEAELPTSHDLGGQTGFPQIVYGLVQKAQFFHGAAANHHSGPFAV